MNIERSGILSAADTKRSIPVPFTVDAEMEWITIHFSYAPFQAVDADWSNQISLSLFDPYRFRGTRHNSETSRFFLSTDTASSGFVAGAIPAGEWFAYLDVHRIIGSGTVSYTISFVSEAEPRWYRGNLHAHTTHSDGRWDIPDLVQYALDEGHDFVALTDHNTVSGLSALGTITAGRIIPIYGSEITTTAGHALALGTRDYFEWRIGTPEAPGIADVYRRVTDSGALFVIAHPNDPGDPACTGCHWEYEEMKPGSARLVEIWNEGWSTSNEQSLASAYSWLNEGYRIVMTAGADIHDDPRTDASGSNSLGLNAVYAEAPTERAILNAIAGGRSYMTSGPVLLLTSSAGSEFGNRFMTGDTIPAGCDIYIHVDTAATDIDDYIRLIRNGDEISRRCVDEKSIRPCHTTAPAGSWFNAELRDSKGTLKAVTNAIFVAGVE